MKILHEIDDLFCSSFVSSRDLVYKCFTTSGNFAGTSLSHLYFFSTLLCEILGLTTNKLAFGPLGGVKLFLKHFPHFHGTMRQQIIWILWCKDDVFSIQFRLLVPCWNCEYKTHKVFFERKAIIWIERENIIRNILLNI